MTTLIVIASGAKESSPAPEWIASSLPLLAMTAGVGR
jgi:hypothetical protein